jgi:L-ascorbate metabolism protein UlaG (beta-lactamase superfamily)
MDSPLVAQLTGAQLLGSLSTLQIGRGAGLADAQMREVKPGEVVTLGRFTLRFVASRHSPTPWTDGDAVETIDAPLAPPAHASAWRTGTVWSLVVEHAGRRALVQASAGFVPGALAGQPAEVVLLGTGTLGKKSPAYRADYWRETVAATGAKRVVPIHWDDFWLPLDDAPLVAMPYLLDDFGATMDDLQTRATAARIELRMPPLRTPFDPFGGLQ